VQLDFAGIVPAIEVNCNDPLRFVADMGRWGR
jgi:hypothetical protein